MDGYRAVLQGMLMGSVWGVYGRLVLKLVNGGCGGGWCLRIGVRGGVFGGSGAVNEHELGGSGSVSE